MVDDLQARDVVHDPRVADALRAVPRELFLDVASRGQAYDDRPVWIGWGQTMSAPHMVAIMCEALELGPGQRVLEVGTGSGYHAAVVARLVAPDGEVVSLEILEPLADHARRSLARAGVTGVHVEVGDGGRGAPDRAPFDRIYLTCSAPRIPDGLRQQLASDGRLVAPVGDAPSRLVRARRRGGVWDEEDLGACAFVPLRGEFGQP